MKRKITFVLLMGVIIIGCICTGRGIGIAFSGFLILMTFVGVSMLKSQDAPMTIRNLNSSLNGMMEEDWEKVDEDSESLSRRNIVGTSENITFNTEMYHRSTRH